MTSRQRGGGHRKWRRLLTERRGAIAVLTALMLPALIASGPLFVDTGYLCFRTVLLRQTVHAAALAAAQTLSNYYTSGTSSTAAIVSAAQNFALANSPSATYGTVVSAANVVVGNWNATTSTFTSLATSGGTAPNAVQVTGVNSAANGNPVKMFFAGLIGMSTMDLSSTATASYATGQNFDTIIINDLSQSFKSEIGNQRTADLAILNCVNASAGSATNFGITTIDGHSSIYQPLLQASTNLSSLETKINALNYCGTTGMPACSGSNVASGIYSAIHQFSSVSSTNTLKNIIIITDGVPNADTGTTYAKADGTYATPTSKTPICSTACTDANLETMAEDQAGNAWAAGISVSTIYYSGDTATGDEATYEAELARWRQGSGVSLVAPTAAKISTILGGFCATMPSALKLVM
jgi:Flp pilus assembly protein TadG